jgi:MYXO-CTERM domain-containing protein
VDTLVVVATRVGTQVQAPVLGGSLTFTRGGAQVPARLEPGPTSDVFFLKPEAALTPGDRYRLTYTFPCGIIGQQMLVSNFDVTEAAELPSTPGTLVVEASGIEGEDKPAQPGECFPNRREAFARLQLQALPAMAKHLPVATLTVLVDGKVYTQIPYGRVSFPVAGARVASPCDAGRATPNDAGLGTREVKFRFQIAGTTTAIETAGLKVDLSCGGARTDAGASNGAGGTTTVDGGSAKGGQPGQAGAGGAGAGSDKRPSGGCRVGRGPDSSPPSVAVVLMVLVALARWRRRRSSRRRITFG